MKKIAPILLSICLIISLWFSSVLTVHAAYSFSYGTTINLTETATYSLNTANSNYKFHRFYDKDNKAVLTLQWLMDNPNYSFKLDWSGTSNNFEYSRFCWSSPNGRLAYIDIPSGSIINYETFANAQFLEYGTATTFSIDRITLSEEMCVWSQNGGTVTAMVNTTVDSEGPNGGNTEGGGTTEDGSTEEDDNDGLFANIKDFFTGIFDKVSEWITNAVNSIGNFFTNALNVIGQFFEDLWNSIAEFFGRLFEPIVEWFENKKQEDESKKTVWDSIGAFLEDLIEKIEGMTLKPVLEFLESMDNSAITVLMEIFDFPIIKDMIVASVAILVVVGLFGFLLTF